MHQSPPPHPPAKSDFWPTVPSREQRGYLKSDPGRDHYYVGCLGQTGVGIKTFYGTVYGCVCVKTEREMMLRRLECKLMH